MRPPPAIQALCLLLGVALAPSPASAAPPPAELETAARQAAEKGHLSQAIALWRSVLERSAKKSDAASRATARWELAALCLAQGQLRQARELLAQAQEDAQAAASPRLLAQVHSAQGLLLAGKSPSEAEPLLRDAIASLSKGPPDGAAARAQNNLGTFLAQCGRHPEAARAFQESAATAAAAQEPAAELLALSNAALNAGQAHQDDDAARLAGEVMEKSAAAPASHGHAMAVVRAGLVLETLDAQPQWREKKVRARAFKAFQRAEALGRELDDDLALSQALGAQGRLYEAEHRPQEALVLTRRAIFHAQAARSAELLFRWHWQSGRLLRDTGELAEALAALRRARTELESIRHDLALHYGSPLSGTSFRETTGGLFVDLADLLLRQADTASGEALQRLLLEARDSAEALKSAELEDYFQDECVSLLRQKITKLETLASGSAVVYFIPLRDRTEILLTTGSTLERIKSPATAAQVEEAATLLRRQLEDRTSNAFLAPAKQLHDWLIAPLGPLLEKARPDTLVFVPDGALRTIPMGVLHDGRQFLIERYAVAVSPGLTLLEAKPLPREHVELMLGGLSQARQDFPALPFVPEELSRLRSLFGGEFLLNADFILPKVKEEFKGRPFTIVHLATHGHFDRDAAKTFVLTFDEKLTLDDLERLLQPARLRDQPVELLTLSACQTAAGDDRAALGLAGVAIKAGARSAFATLWFVNDAASAEVVSNFYETLKRSPKLNKAQALQAAQKRLLADPRYEHPCYWAPYLLIGNWL